MGLLEGGVVGARLVDGAADGCAVGFMEGWSDGLHEFDGLTVGFNVGF